MQEDSLVVKSATVGLAEYERGIREWVGPRWVGSRYSVSLVFECDEEGLLAIQKACASLGFRLDEAAGR